jgi:hypothetical protein
MNSEENKIPLRPPWRVLKLKVSSKVSGWLEKRLEMQGSLSVFVEDSAKIGENPRESVGFLVFGGPASKKSLFVFVRTLFHILMRVGLELIVF